MWRSMELNYIDVVSISPEMSALENTFELFKLIEHTLFSRSSNVLKDTGRIFFWELTVQGNESVPEKYWEK